MALQLTTVPVETAIADADEIYFNDTSETPDALNRITFANLKTSVIADVTDHALHFDETYHQHANHGPYWRRDKAYSIFFYEAWINAESGAEYIISDGYGGAHNLLWGANVSGGYGSVTGNVWMDGGAVSFASIDSIYAGDWHHLAVGWDGNYIYTWVDGVLSKRTAATGIRQTTGDASEGVMFVGGSDHSNYNGMIRSVRGFEDIFPFDSVKSYRPERSPRSSYVLDGTIKSASFLVDYSSPQTILIDQSDGFTNGIRQKITNTVVAASGITSNGDMRNIVTAAGMSNSPKTVTTAGTTGAHTTAALIAAAMRTSLRADADVNSFFTVHGTGADIILLAIDPNDNDATMNITIEDVTSAGITEDTSAVQTTAGVKGERVRHHGIASSELDGTMTGGFESSRVAGYTTNLPEFRVADFAQPTTFRGTQAAIPGSAVVFDDFSRANVTRLWSETLGIGTSRTSQVWTGSNCGIIDGCAYYWGANTEDALIETSQTDMDVRITRKTGSQHGPGIVARYTDANNYIGSYTDAGYWHVYEYVAGVYAGIQSVFVDTTWTELRLVLTGTTIDLYINGSGSASATDTVVNASGTKAGMTLVPYSRVETFVVY